MHEIVQASRGFQLLQTYHFNHHIKCVAQQASDAVGVFYNVGSDNVACVCPYKQNEPRTKYYTDDNISALIYIKKYRLYVASCSDLALRIYGEHFELIDTVHVTATVLSLVFNESTSELFTGSVGCIDTWKLRHQYHNPLIPSTPLKCSIQKQQWIVSLELDYCTEKLVATCRDAVYVIDTHTYEQIVSFSNTHHGSLTSSVLVDHLGFLITAAKDGTIKVWNTLLHNEIHTFAGHVKAVTGLKADPSVPCVISCSADGSVRIWHLENMTECCRMDCGEELLGMCGDIPSGNKLACYSHCNLNLWTVNQLETPFASINSHVVHMTRIEGPMAEFSKHRPPHPTARILALAEDGGVRLISPVSGQVLAILLPMSSAQLLQDVVYSLVDNLLFVLLKSNNVLLCTAAVNPCSALELWDSNKTQMKINCIAKVVCNVEFDNDRRKECTLVFGGQEDGNIGLLFSSGGSLSMPHPCPAHDGHVIKLIGSCDPIQLSTKEESSNFTSSALVSYGTDNMLNIWVISLERHTSLFLRLQMCVLMDLVPVHFKLLDSIVCVTLIDHSLLMFHTRARWNKTDNRLIMTSCSFSKLQSMRHQLEDEHTDKILTLEASTVLGLFVTTSNDRHIKIWNKQNQLISEMFFGRELSSACFLNPRGDLLVGFQKNIRVIQADDYLPAHYLEIGRGYPQSDDKETQIPFDPDLEFWYDSKRIPSLPPQQEMRQQYLQTHPGISTLQCLMETSTMSSSEDSGSVVSLSVEKTSGVCLDSKVDTTLARKLSQQYFTELSEQKPCTKIRRLIPHQVYISPSEEAYSSVDGDDLSATTSSPLFAESSHRSIGGGGGKNRSCQTSLSSLVFRQKSVPLQRHRKAIVSPLESPSTKMCIAPDGHIPNSVLRAQIGYTPPIVVPLPPYRPPDLRRKMVAIAEEKRLNRKESSCSSSTPELYQFDSSLEMSVNTDTDSEDSVTCVSGVLRQELMKERELALTNRSNMKQLVAAAQKRKKKIPKDDLSTAYDFIDQIPSNVSVEIEINRKGTKSTVSKASSDRQHPATITGRNESSTKQDQSSVFPTPLNVTSLGPHTKAPAASQRRVSINAVPHDLMASTAPPPTPNIVNIGAPDNTTTRGSVDSQYHPTSAGVNGSTSGRVSTLQSRHRRSLVIGASGRREGVDIPSTAGNYSNGVDEDKVDSLLRKICSRAWFPKESSSSVGRDIAVTVESVLEVLLQMVKCSKVPEFNKACRAVVELDRVGVLDSCQLEVVSNTIATRLQGTLNLTPSSSVSIIKTAALNSLEKLGVAAHSALLAILPCLTDSDSEVCAAAFRALKQLTGVVNRDQLRQLLVEMDMLRYVDNNEDEVLRELEQRIKNGVVNISSSNSLLTKIRITTKPHPLGSTHNNHTLQTDHHHQVHHQFPHTNKPTRTSNSHQTQPHNKHHRHGKHKHLTPLDNRYHQSSTITRRLTQVGSKDSSISITHYVYTPLTGSAQGRGRLASSGQLRGDHGGGMKKTTRHLNKLRQYIAHHPNVLSQMEPTIRMMLKAYGVEVPPHTTTTNTAAGDNQDHLSQLYEWSEVFPVVDSSSLWPEVNKHGCTIRTPNCHTPRAQQATRPRRQEQYQESHSECEGGTGRTLLLEEGSGGCDGVAGIATRCKYESTTAATQMMVTVKLPKITSSRLTQT